MALLARLPDHMSEELLELALLVQAPVQVPVRDLGQEQLACFRH